KILLMSRHSFSETFVFESRLSEKAWWFFKIQSTLLQNFFAALIQYIAATVLHALEQSLHCLKPLHPFPKFRDFSLRELMPALRRTRSGREPEKELPYFRKREPRLSSALHDRQAKKHAAIVTTLAILSDRRWKNPDLLVVANRRGAQTKC